MEVRHWLVCVILLSRCRQGRKDNCVAVCGTLKGMTLDPTQIRVLGALIEKEIVTPETYPLSLNALLAACNQRSSRDPVMDLAEDEVRQALHTLEDMGLTSVVRDSRAALRRDRGPGTALGAAGNRRRSRDPVMELAEDQARQALHTLEDMRLSR